MPREVDVRYDVRIPTADAGVSLSADIYFPAETEPAPCLLVAHPYRKDSAGPGGDPLLHWFAERGYVSVVVDLRGTGASDGHYREFARVEQADLARTIEWLAQQPWCDGNVGMWGHSYGAWTALNAAASKPRPLKAIVAVQGPTDPGRELIYPDGARTDLRTCFRTLLTLINAFTPPLRDGYAEPDDRWRQRLSEAEPAFCDVAEYPPDDPIWSEVAIDPGAITIPVLYIGGWRDFLIGSVTNAYARISGSKQLLVGPWGHTLPHLAAEDAVDFPSTALAWFDHWLRGVANDVMDKLPVTLHLPEAGWRAFESWPPPTQAQRFSTGTGSTLRPGSPSGGDTSIGVYRPDPTIGSLRGFWGSTLGGVVELPDQHDDDLRALSATSDPLAHDLLVVGSAKVMVMIADSHAAEKCVERLVVALTDVDSEGRSTLVATGVTTVQMPVGQVQVVLAPTAWRFPAGSRLRVALSDADFPRLTPPPRVSPVPVAAIELLLPVLADDAGVAASPARADQASRALPPIWRRTLGQTAASRVAPRAAAPAAYSIMRELIEDHLEVVLTRSSDDGGFEIRGSIRRSDPTAALITGEQSRRVTLVTGEEMTISASVRCTQQSFWARADVAVDGATIASRTWDVALKSNILPAN